MNEHFYMFSSGSYSDYSVGGLYKSKEKYSEEDFARILKEDFIEQMPSAYEYLCTLPLDISVLTGYYGFKDNLYAFMTQDTKPINCSTEEASDWWKRKEGWFKNNPLDTSLSSVLMRKGIIEEIAYEEIHNDN